MSYLFYATFDVWWYLRFLLPTFPVMLVLSAMGCVLLLRVIRSEQVRSVLVAAIVVAVLSMRVGFVRGELTGHWREGVPFTSVGEYVRARLPSNALIITLMQSGSIRYYAQRQTLRWDLLGPEWWPRAAQLLFERGYRPYVLLASFEEELFRRRFGLSSESDAPGTAVATFDWDVTTRLYDPLRLTSDVSQAIPAVVARPCGCW